MSVKLKARATLLKGAMLNVVVTNLSHDGCEVHASETLQIGAKLMLDLSDNIRRSAQVRWAMIGRAGLRFSERLK